MDAPTPTQPAWPDAQISDLQGQSATDQVIPGRLFGLQGRLARPFWGVMGVWATACGAVASNQFHWAASDLLTLALVLILVDLAWGSLWDLVVGIDWRRLWAGRRRPAQPELFAARPAKLVGLPYTQPGSPGGRIFGGLSRFACRWREDFWPEAGPAVLGSLAAVAVAVVVSLLLPERLRVLNVALVALAGLGLIQRLQGRAPLAVQALVLVGLSWLAGHATFAQVSRPSLILVTAFTLATWGALRAAGGPRRGSWLLNGGQMLAVAIVAAMKQPLAAGLMGLLVFGQIALQPALSLGEGPALKREQDLVRILRRSWPWLLATMIVAAWAVP